MGEPSRTETPRDELRRRIEAVIVDHGVTPSGNLADAIVGLFLSVGEDYQDLDVTAFADERQQIWRQRWIVARLGREAEPERIEGAWRG